MASSRNNDKKVKTYENDSMFFSPLGFIPTTEHMLCFFEEVREAREAAAANAPKDPYAAKRNGGYK